MQYSKYIESTGTHYISNSGSDENGKYKGGAAGDQNGKEWQLKKWYSRPWSHVLRHPDPEVALMIAQHACAAALNDVIGYDQNQRKTYWNELQKAGYEPSAVTTPCEADCTAGITANVRAVGFLMGLPELQSIPVDTYSGSMRSNFKRAGFEVLTDKKFINGVSYLLPGDILLYEGHHAATNITKGANAVWGLDDGKRVLRNGSVGADVKQMQTQLINLGYDLGKWGADGEFGEATEAALAAFQTDANIPVTHALDDITADALEAALAALEDQRDEPEIKPEEIQTVEIVDGNCYVRDAPSADGKKRGTAHRGEEYPYLGETSENGWNLIRYKDFPGWVSGKYSRRK